MEAGLQGRRMEMLVIFLILLLLTLAALVAFYVWTRFEYAGMTGCPWGTSQSGHPVRVGAVTTGCAAAVAALLGMRFARTSYAIVGGLVTLGVCAVLTWGLALAVGAPLHCFD